MIQRKKLLLLAFVGAVIAGVVALAAGAAAQDVVPPEIQATLPEDNNGIDIAAVIALIAGLPFMGTIVSKFYELVKRLTDKDWKGVIGQAVMEFGGVAVLWLASESDLAGSIGAGAFNLETANFGTIVLLGLMTGSTASVGYDWERALDNRDTAMQPILGGGMPAVPCPEAGVVLPTANA